MLGKYLKKSSYIRRSFSSKPIIKTEEQIIAFNSDN